MIYESAWTIESTTWYHILYHNWDISLGLGQSFKIL